MAGSAPAAAPQLFVKTLRFVPAAVLGWPRTMESWSAPGSASRRSRSSYQPQSWNCELVAAIFGQGNTALDDDRAAASGWSGRCYSFVSSAGLGTMEPWVDGDGDVGGRCRRRVGRREKDGGVVGG